nr:glycerol-3-phosphate dehydrogenase/oxidase [Rubripirellula reticaptiva]
MSRDESIDRLRQRTTPWDIVVIGGGATGVGVAMDAASRGLDVLLVEQSDLGKGTSSRSTKLVHGGVRYLRQGNITLVRDALRERTLLRNNAPHLVHDLKFLIPCHNLWQRLFYGIGLKVYDFLAGGNNFGRSHGVSTKHAMVAVPGLRRDGFRGGVIYHDGQFDDARLLLNMARTAHDHGACVLNYMTVTDLTKNDKGAITGVTAIDQEKGEEFLINSRCVVNAAGPFCDSVRKLDDGNCEAMLAHSQGVHLVLPRAFFPGDTAMIVPKTPDGRVIFIIPWHGHAVVGTTDTPISDPTLEPVPQVDEIQFLLDMSAAYLSKAPKIEDVLSIFTGIRPLVKGDKSARTASLSRDHVIRVSSSGLLTITGGKWTTVRKMAEDCVDRVIKETKLASANCKTQSLKLHGYTESSLVNDPRGFYGADLEAITALESEINELAKPICDSLPIRESDIIWAVRNEMARTVEDALARRTRALFLNAEAALKIAPAVAQLMAAELGKDDAWCREQIESFESVAANYIPQQGSK